jgi:V8-like Glu-specific endopeptidase
MKNISITTRGVFALAAFAAGIGSFGCAEPEDPATTTSSHDEEVLGAKVAQPIVNGSPASAYTEAALINAPDFICSGAVIAPRIVLTAGHCVVDASTWTVTAPYAGNQSAKGSKSWTDYASSGEYVNPSTLDVAVIILDKPITLSTYPTLASAASAAGTKAVNVGRIRNGQASFSGLFFGSQVTLKAGSSYGFPKSYVSEEIIESGDSGGPVYIGSGASRVIAAVNSGGGGGTQVLARVDLAYAKIQQLIAANGGSGASGTASPPPPAPTPTPAPTPACSSGTPESEPNDTSSTPNALSGTRCGSLSTGSDVDWYAWSVDKAGVAYDVSLATAGDADVLMWKWNGSAWNQINNVSPTKIAATSSGAGNYLVAVRGGAAQSYTLKLTK